MPGSYLTIAAEAEAVFTDRRSRFMAFARPVACAAEARALVTELQKRYFDARHVCWAYMLGSDRNEFMCNDNGEPSGTAGKPILGQINSLGLTNVTVAVVRYFGGIKLGTPGLIAAYREAARMALTAAGIVERHDMGRITFTFPYPAMNDVMRLTKTPGIEVVQRAFDNTCSMTIEVRAAELPGIRGRLADIDGTSISDN